MIKSSTRMCRRQSQRGSSYPSQFRGVRHSIRFVYGGTSFVQSSIRFSSSYTGSVNKKWGRYTLALALGLCGMGSLGYSLPVDAAGTVACTAKCELGVELEKECEIDCDTPTAYPVTCKKRRGPEDKAWQRAKGDWCWWRQRTSSQARKAQKGLGVRVHDITNNPQPLSRVFESSDAVLLQVWESGCFACEKSDVVLDQVLYSILGQPIQVYKVRASAVPELQGEGTPRFYYYPKSDSGPRRRQINYDHYLNRRACRHPPASALSLLDFIRSHEKAVPVADWKKITARCKSADSSTLYHLETKVLGPKLDRMFEAPMRRRNPCAEVCRDGLSALVLAQSVPYRFDPEEVREAYDQCVEEHPQAEAQLRQVLPNQF